MSRPQLSDNLNLTAGIAAIGLFVVLALVFVGAEFPNPVGFGTEGTNVMRGIGFALFDLVGQQGVPAGTEGFLLAFELIDLVLVAALVGAIMLARREEDDELRKTLTDGGRDDE